MIEEIRESKHNFKSKFFSLLVILCIFLTISCVCAADNQKDVEVTCQSDIEMDSVLESVSESMDDVQSIDEGDIETNFGNQEKYTFKNLWQDILNSDHTFNVEHNYTYDENDGDKVILNNSDIVINGNGFTIDGANSDCGLCFWDGDDDEINFINVTINNLTFRNINGIALEVKCVNLTLENVNFINCSSPGEIVLCNFFSKSNLDNLYFEDINCFNFINSDNSDTRIINSHFGGAGNNDSAIIADRGSLIVENCVFENFISTRAAIINFKGDHIAVKNSKFSNFNAQGSGGAIIAKFFPFAEDEESGFRPAVDFLIENCQFNNLSAGNDGGAVYCVLDSDSDSANIVKGLNIVNSNFTYCTSRFGGAIAVQCGFLNIIDSNLINNTAGFGGGAIFTSWSNVNITNSNLINNTGIKNAGAVYFDKGNLTIGFSNLINNKIIEKSDMTAMCIYAYAVDAYFFNSTFDNGEISIYADFVGKYKFENLTQNEDIFLMDNRNYVFFC